MADDDNDDGRKGYGLPEAGAAALAGTGAAFGAKAFINRDAKKAPAAEAAQPKPAADATTQTATEAPKPNAGEAPATVPPEVQATDHPKNAENPNTTETHTASTTGAVANEAENAARTTAGVVEREALKFKDLVNKGNRGKLAVVASATAIGAAGAGWAVHKFRNRNADTHAERVAANTNTQAADASRTA